MMLCCFVIAITMLLACYVMLCYWRAAEGGTRWSGFLSADNLSYKQYKKDIMLYGNIFVFQLLLLLVPPSPPLIPLHWFCLVMPAIVGLPWNLAALGGASKADLKRTS